jgi:hypothetical protein
MLTSLYLQLPRQQQEPWMRMSSILHARCGSASEWPDVRRRLLSLINRLGPLSLVKEPCVRGVIWNLTLSLAGAKALM